MPRGNVSGCQGCRGQCCRMYTVPLTGHDAFVIARELQLSLEQFAHLLPEPEPTATGVRLAPDAHPASLSLRRATDEAAPHRCVFLVTLDAGFERCGIHPQRPYVCRTYPARFRHGSVAIRDDAPVSARRLEHQRPRPSRVAADDAAPGARVDGVRLRRRALERGRRRARRAGRVLRLAARRLRAAGRRCGPSSRPVAFDDNGPSLGSTSRVQPVRRPHGARRNRRRFPDNARPCPRTPPPLQRPRPGRGAPRRHAAGAALRPDDRRRVQHRRRRARALRRRRSRRARASPASRSRRSRSAGRG